MLSLDEALTRLLALARPTDTETIPLDAALGRVLAEPRMRAPIAVPPFDNSAMDGYAVRAADTPGELALGEEIAAGGAPGPVLPAGTARPIMTGGPMPPGADTVVPVEVAVEHDGRVRLPAAERGAYVRTTGSDTPEGSEVCLPGGLTPAGIAVLASLGIGSVSVRRIPVVALLSTGDELVRPGHALAPGQIYDANGPALAAAVLDAGAVPRRRPAVRDDASAVADALHEASGAADLVITSGGVSVGRHDHVRSVLEQRGSLDFWRIAVQPGKPLAVGTYGDAIVVGLPGNPVSALVTFELFVRPYLRRAVGLDGDGRMRVRARPVAPIAKDPSRRAFLRVTARREGDEIRARAAGGQGSAQLRPLAEANGLLIVPEGEPAADPSRDYETIVTGSLP